MCFLKTCLFSWFQQFLLHKAFHISPSCSPRITIDVCVPTWMFTSVCVCTECVRVAACVRARARACVCVCVCVRTRLCMFVSVFHAHGVRLCLDKFCSMLPDIKLVLSFCERALVSFYTRTVLLCLFSLFFSQETQYINQYICWQSHTCSLATWLRAFSAADELVS